MGYQIIKQPDDTEDKFAIFSSFTDTIIVWDATEVEITNWFVEEAAERTRASVRQTLEHVTAGEPRRAYFQFAMTWEQAMQEDRKHDGVAWREYLNAPSPTSDH